MSESGLSAQMRPTPRRRDASTGRFVKWASKIVDSVVEVISPKRGRLRKVERMRTQYGASLTAASQANEALIAFQPSTQDANAATLVDLPLSRARCRELGQNNAAARALRRTLCDYVVGRGIVPTSMPNPSRLGISEGDAKDWQQATDELFRDESAHADIQERTKFAPLQQLIFKSLFDGGDVLVAYPMLSKRDALERESQTRQRMYLIEAERCDTPPDKTSDPTVRAGVQLGKKWDEPRGFYVSRGHPGDARDMGRAQQFQFWKRRKARMVADGRIVTRTNVTQAYNVDRIGQARGVPWLNPVVPLVEAIDQYITTTLDAAELQTKLSLWIETQGDLERAEQLFALQSVGIVPPEQTSLENRADYTSLQGAEIESGGLNVLSNGDKINTSSPAIPNTFFDPLLVRLLRLLGAGAGGVPYEIFGNDVKGANYSSIRAGFMGLQKTLHHAQQMVVGTCDPYRRLVILEAWLDKRLPNFGINIEDDLDGWCQCQWATPAIGWIDPPKEVAAFGDAVDRGFMTVGEVIGATSGGTHESVSRRRKNEIDFEAEIKLVRPATGASAAPAPEEQDQAEERDEDDDEAARGGQRDTRRYEVPCEARQREKRRQGTP